MAKRAHTMPPGLDVGVLVEAAPHAYAGSWFEAEVLELTAKDALLAFTQLKGEEAGDDLPRQEWHTLRNLRPMPPTDEQENFPAILDRGDRCELNYDDAWWECTVLSVHPDPDGGETEFVLRPTQYSEKHRVGEDRVRPPWAWQSGEWVLPYNAKTRKRTVIGPHTEGVRRPDLPTLPEGTPHLDRPEPEEKVAKVPKEKGEKAEPKEKGGGSSAGTKTREARGIDEEGYGPPEARPSSFAEGTSRTGVDGRQWIVVSIDNGAYVWSLPGQAMFFIERNKRDQLQKKKAKGDQQRKQIRDIKAEAQKATRAAAAKEQRDSGLRRKPEPPPPGVSAAANRELGNVQCALDVQVQAAPKKAGKGAARSAAADHERVLQVLEALISSKGELVLSQISTDAVETSDASATGLAGVHARDAGRDTFDVQVGGKNIGHCDTAIKGAKLRALYVRILADLVADKTSRPLTTRAMEQEPLGEVSPTLDGLILGRLGQLERQRQFAHMADKLASSI